MSFIEINELTISQGDKDILKNMNLTFEKGKLYGILGPNGAGKSTLFKAMTKQVKRKQGNIFIETSSIDNYSVQSLAKKISLMTQNFNLNFPYSVEEIVSMGRFPYSRGNLNKEDIKEINKAIIEANIENIRDRSVNKLSGGERQRVLLGKILCQNTDVILIDEGFSNMDIYYQIEFIKLLRDKVHKENKLIIFIMHDLVLAKEYCDEILLLKAGEIYGFKDSKTILNDKSLYDVFNIKGRFKEYSLELF